MSIELDVEPGEKTHPEQPVDSATISAISIALHGDCDVVGLQLAEFYCVSPPQDRFADAVRRVQLDLAFFPDNELRGGSKAASDRNERGSSVQSKTTARAIHLNDHVDHISTAGSNDCFTAIDAGFSGAVSLTGETGKDKPGLTGVIPGGVECNPFSDWPHRLAILP